MTDETIVHIARSAAMRWCAAWHAPSTVAELLEKRLVDLATTFTCRSLTGAAIDRLGLECVRRVAELEVPREHVERARSLLQTMR